MSFRRVNRSKKVPGVKLRPAAPGEAIASKQRDRILAQSSWVYNEDDEVEHSENGSIDLCPRPFRGVIVCATGVKDKINLFKKALELGAVALDDFTDRVTHLIAEGPGSAKYQCALEQRVPIMHPSWIVESYQTWLQGDDVDLKGSIAAHRLPIFTGVVLCLSGIEDIPRRTMINRKVTAEGGSYTKNLERPIRVTHLLCASITEGVTEKMKYAQKFNQAGEANIELVWEEWFWDCLMVGGKLDVEPYRITNAPRPRLILPEEPDPLPSSNPTQPPATPPSSASSSNPLPKPVHLRDDDDDDDEEEIAVVKRVPAVTLQIWEKLLKPRGFEVAQGKLVRSPSKSQSLAAGKDLRSSSRERSVSPTRNKGKQPQARMDEQTGEGTSRRSMLSSFRRTTSFAPAVPRDVPRSSQPFRRTNTMTDLTSSFLAARTPPAVIPGEVSDTVEVSHSAQAKGEQREEPGPSHSRPFSGMRFRVLGEANCETVHSALRNHGGLIVSENDGDAVDFVIVRLISASEFYAEESDEAERAKYRTECWLERCIFDERICAPEEHITFTPLKIETPILDAERIVLSHSGLEQAEACWVRRLLRVLGITLAKNFSRRSTHLLCPSGTGPKAEKAREWGIPVVDMEWLTGVATTGVVQSSSIEQERQSCSSPHEASPFVEDVQPPLIDRKGKGKERATDSMMADITNGHSALDHPSHHPPDPDGHPEVHEDVQTMDFVSSPRQADEEDSVGAFGLPGALLSNPLDRGLSDATPPLPIRGPSAEPQTAPSSPSFQNQHTSPPQPSLERERDKASMRIPSSASPSPLRILPGEGSAGISGGRSGSSSPAKISKKASRILQQSITTLLGKRPSEEDAGHADSAAVTSGGVRAGKRARPHSKGKVDAVAPVDPEILPTLQRPGKGVQSVSPPPGSDAGSSVNVQTEGDQNVYITYEDPTQRDEKKRLLHMLESEKEGVEWEVAAAVAPASRTNSRAGRRKGRASARC